MATRTWFVGFPRRRRLLARVFRITCFACHAIATSAALTQAAPIHYANDPITADRALRNIDAPVHCAAILLRRVDSFAPWTRPAISPIWASSRSTGSNGFLPRAHVGAVETLLAQYQYQAANPPAPSPKSPMATLTHFIAPPPPRGLQPSSRIA